MPGDLNETKYSAPRVKKIGKDGDNMKYFVSMQTRTSGDRQGDWNEPDSYDSANAHYYVVDVPLKTEKEQKKEERIRKRKAQKAKAAKPKRVEEKLED
jgi:hypothetical protein